MTTSSDLDDPAFGAPPPKLPAFLLVLGLLSLLLGLGALYALGYFDASSDASPTLRGFNYDPPDPAPDFELIDASGQPYRLSDGAGQARLLFFGFTHCPDVCPTTLARLATALDQLGPDAARSRVLFVSVDPERDTPERIGSYLADFESPMTGLTGPIPALEAMAASYHVAFFKDPPDAEGDDYTMVHSGSVFLIDPAGFLRASYMDPILPEDLAHDLKLVLAEQD
jgi:protein SCO1/2